MDKYVTDEILADIDVLFNGGHLSLYRNTDECRNLYRQSGSIFPWTTVISKNATFAFDEVTGMYKIAQSNQVKARYGILSVDCDQRYTQLRHRMEESQPDNQCFYWEKGHVIRACLGDNNEQVKFQEVSYIHIPQRNLGLVDSAESLTDGFWITPEGFEKKEYLGLPNREDIILKNPFMGLKKMKHQRRVYIVKKIIKFVRKGPYQVYVRLKQHFAGMTKALGKGKEMKWTSF